MACRERPLYKLYEYEANCSSIWVAEGHSLLSIYTANLPQTGLTCFLVKGTITQRGRLRGIKGRGHQDTGVKLRRILSGEKLYHCWQG